MNYEKRLRRMVLAVLATGALAAPVIAAGCASEFSDPSQITTLRVLSVEIDKPYANPGDRVHFKLNYADGFPGGPRDVQILWLGGCFNPAGDAYYACYEQILPANAGGGLIPAPGGGGIPGAGSSAIVGADGGTGLAADVNASSSSVPPARCLYLDAGGLTAKLGPGPTCEEFTLELPEDLITSRPKPEVPPHYAIAYVFFAVCAGTLVPISTETDARAAAFPLGCFDKKGNQLGADSFVPGYTQVYSFEDGRTNHNPIVAGMSLDKKPIDENPDPAALPVVEACPITEEERRVTGCNAPDIPATCRQYDFDVLVGASVAEPDGDAKTTDGKPLREIVWVNYFVDAGELSSPIKLISDAVKGYQADHKTAWTPPDTPGEVTLWAVVRDSRGGSTILERHMMVQ